MDWQPIATMPKNGTPVLAYFNPRWMETVEYSNGYLHYSADGEYVEGKQPSHWMPLPPAPAETA